MMIRPVVSIAPSNNNPAKNPFIKNETKKPSKENSFRAILECIIERK
jgi:hypothetical protein